jgi:hypothetical protein
MDPSLYGESNLKDSDVSQPLLTVMNKAEKL